MYLLFTTPSCCRCKVAKQILEERGLEYKEIDVTASEENMKLAEQYNIFMGGTVIDSETNQIIEL